MLIDIGGKDETHFDKIVEDIPYLKKLDKYTDL